MVLPALEVAGMETVAAILTRGLARRGHEVGVTCLEHGGLIADELRAAGFRVAIVPTPGLRTIIRPVELEAWLRRLSPDVVHVHSGAWLKAARAARRAGVPYVVHTEHGLFDAEPWYGALLRRCAARCTDRVVAVSESLRQYLARTVGLPPAMVTVIPNGIDVRTFRPGPRRTAWRAPLGIAPEASVIGNVARLSDVKNHTDLIAAFAELRRQVPDAVLVIAGEGPMRNALEMQASALGQAEQVRFLGETRDVAALYREFDLFVLSSKSEGTSISLLEAMASGVCVVATAVGGTPALLGEGRVGRLVSPGDPAALADAMADLLRNHRERRELAEGGRRQVVTTYSLEAMLNGYEQVYAQATPSLRSRIGAGSA